MGPWGTVGDTPGPTGDHMGDHRGSLEVVRGGVRGWSRLCNLLILLYLTYVGGCC